ncbi:MAG: hybrid sensor histidine kinase/response regulator [Verrucomicrobiota bacterium]|nr:hybrid sensor histidine kinase/response regulator [Verrucomicrobiota bacterium]
MNFEFIETETKEPVILVVDDIQTNIQVVGSVLAEAGYEIIPALSGAQALERLGAQLPDLILLDYRMPEMNGLEVLQQLKMGAATKKIPVIFLTASNELEDLVQAFGSGAVDYITKPFNTAELLARVRTHLELKRARDMVWKYAERLRELNYEKNEFLGIAAHDLRSPLSNIVSLAEMIETEPDMPREQTLEFVEIIKEAAHHMMALVENLLDVNTIDRGQMNIELGPFDVAPIIESVARNYEANAKVKQQMIKLEIAVRPAIAYTDFRVTTQVIDNLLSNAIKYSPKAKTILVRVLPAGDSLRLIVEDQGPGLSEADQKKLFGKFARLTPKPTGGEASTGLGLSIVKKMVEAVKAKVWCESELGKGTRFIVDFPTSPQES